jgi:hypothetical protein
MSTYRKSVLAPVERSIFDPSNAKHMLDFARFVKYDNWKNGCHYYLPTMIRAKIADYTLSKLVEKV